MLHRLQLSCKVTQLHYTNNGGANVTRALQKVLQGVFSLWNLRPTVLSGMQSPVLLWICSHKSFISVTAHRGRALFNWKEGNVMRPSTSENVCANPNVSRSRDRTAFYNLYCCLWKMYISLSEIFMLLPFTFFDSKTQWLFPSSLIWFHQRRPTNNLPDTFWGRIQDTKHLTLFLL